jgi:dihydrofolate reductase
VTRATGEPKTLIHLPDRGGREQLYPPKVVERRSYEESSRIGVRVAGRRHRKTGLVVTTHGRRTAELGRVTYEELAAQWPHLSEQYGEYADMMNSYPKYVVSTTLQEPLEWNASLIKGDVAEDVSRLKQQPGKDILVFGSGDLVNTLMKHNLVDECRLMVFPIVVGSRKHLFEDGLNTTVLELVDTKAFGSGVVVLTYQPTQS